ncbi:MAG TPA: MFS transporter [Chitinophagales bacterium]|nr:MFS transporter [Chitinophagales bacterium]
MSETQNKGLKLLILVAALGYFVDVYDLVLFGVIRVPSLKGIGITSDADIATYGKMLFNYQMYGMLIGGIFWGILGDKKGRLSVLFGSIFLYSIANVLNGMITTIEQYTILRFIAGFGLAGELGAGITLVSESMTKEKRGYGTTIIASVGVIGAVVASLLASYPDLINWRTNYYIGGAMGFALLIMRIGVAESSMYKNLAQEKTVSKGNFLSLFRNFSTFSKYFSVIIVGIPIWYCINTFVFFSKEMGQAMNMTDIPVPAKAIMYNYIGLCFGDIASGLISQYLKSRKRAILLFLCLSILSIAFYLTLGKQNLTYFYIACTIVGFTAGYWAVFNITASEQFGTNLRATVTTSTPNFVRGAVPLVNILAGGFISNGQSYINSYLFVGAIVFGLAFMALLTLKETFSKDLNYVE